MKGLKADGSKFDLEGVSFPTTYAGAPAIQTHIRDITHKKQLEEHLSRTEKLAALGQLAAGVAHEINNPLGGILVYAYLLLEDLEEGRPERAQAEKIVREATRCKEIIQGLLEFSRHMPSKMTPLNVNGVLEEVFSLVGDHLLFQNIDLVQELDPRLPLILGDKNRLEQVFINLLMNSGESMQGEGRLTVTHRGGAGKGPGAAQFRGQRARHPGQLSQPPVRSLLHQQGGGPGGGAGAVHQLRHHPEAPGPDLCGADRSRRHHLRHRTAGLPRRGRENRRVPDLKQKCTSLGPDCGLGSRRG